MQATDKPEFLKVLNGMAAIKKTALIPEVIELWWGCMADWEIEDFKTAAIHALKTCTFMPSPKNFEDMRRAGRMTGAEAWDQALSWAASSAYRRGPMKHEPIDRCVRVIGGYSAIAMCDESKLHFLERRFCEHWETMQDSDEVRVALPKITGDWLTLTANHMKRIA